MRTRLNTGEASWGSRLEVSRIFPPVCLLGIAALTTLTAVYFSSWQAAWLAALAFLTWRLPHWGAPLFLVAVSIDWAEPLLGGILVSFSELELAGVMLGWIGGSRLQKADWRPLLWALPFLAAVALSGAFNTSWFKVPPHLLRASELAAAALLTASVYGGRKDRKLMAAAIATAAVFYSMSGLLQFRERAVYRVFSFFDNPNQFGAYTNLLLPFVVSLALFCRRRLTRLLWIYLAALLVAAQMFSFSRGAMLGAVMAVLTVGFTFYRGSMRRLLETPAAVILRFFRRWGLILVGHAVVLAGIGMAAADAIDWKALLEKPAAVLTLRWKDTVHAGRPIDVRTAHMKLGFEMWKDRPLLGVGPGNYQEAVEDYKEVWKEDTELAGLLESAPMLHIHSHNLVIQLGVQYGLLGMLAFFYLVVRFFRQLLQAGPVTAWRLGGLGLLVAFCIHNLVDVTFPSLALETGLLLGLALADANRQDAKTPRFL